MPKLQILPASEPDVPLILELILALAEYEKLAHCVTATEERVRETLFGANRAAQVVLARYDDECAGFAVFFQTYSTFLAQPGIYLEDLYVKPHLRGRGIGLALLKHLARIAAAAIAAGWNGEYSTGTSRRSGSTRSSAQSRWMSGLSTGYQESLSWIWLVRDNMDHDKEI